MWNQRQRNASLSGGQHEVASRSLLQDIAADALEELQILYHKPNSSPAQPSLQWCNEGGLVAYRDPKVLADILECVREWAVHSLPFRATWSPTYQKWEQREWKDKVLTVKEKRLSKWKTEKYYDSLVWWQKWRLSLKGQSQYTTCKCVWSLLKQAEIFFLLPCNLSSPFFYIII